MSQSAASSGRRPPARKRWLQTPWKGTQRSAPSGLRGESKSFSWDWFPSGTYKDAAHYSIQIAQNHEQNDRFLQIYGQVGHFIVNLLHNGGPVEKAPPRSAVRNLVRSMSPDQVIEKPICTNFM